MVYILFVLALISSCAMRDPRTISGVNDTFKPYIQMYVDAKGSGLGYDIPMQFAKLSGNTVGVCTRWYSGYRQVQINIDYWEHDLSEEEKIQTIFHELGHCDLGRDHDETVDDYGYPHSIMFPYVFPIYSYQMSYYIRELFRRDWSAYKTTYPDNPYPCVVDK